MAEDKGDKTEAPTAKRRSEARDNGQIPRSNDLTSAALLIGFLLLLRSAGPGLVSALKQVIAKFLGAQALGESDPRLLAKSVADALGPVAWSLAPVFGGALVIAVAANMAQVGFNFNTKRLQPNLSALNPFRGLGRIFSAGGGGVQLLLNVLKVVVISMVAYSAVGDRLGVIVASQNLEFTQIFGLGASLVYQIALRVGIVLLVLAVIDYVYQRTRIERELKMTKQEVKDEMRSMDGDPKVKQRRRQVAMQLIQQRLKKDVPTADVVVTNPTEFAVAIKYDAGAMNAPRVVAKGQGFIAQRIREIAIASGVPILERKPLARALFKLVQVGQEVPEQFYAAIAEILAYVYELSGKLRQRKSA